MSIKTLYMYDLINSVYQFSMDITILTFVVSIVCLVCTFINSQNSDIFSFKEAFKKHKKLVWSLITLVIVSSIILILLPSEATINAYFGADVIK